MAPPPYPPHSAPPSAIQNGLYSPHMPTAPTPHHAHHLVPHTVHIENCHVNLSPYGNPTHHPQPPLYAHPPPYQGPPHPHQVFQPFLIGEQSPVMHMKGSDFEAKRHDPHGRGYVRGARGRGGRGPRRKGRDDSDRSNSVSSDHSSYSDSGNKSHYKDAVPPPPPPSHFAPPHTLLSYPHYMHYPVNSLSRPQQGFPLLQQSFIPDPYSHPQPSHILAYSTPAHHHPVSMMSSEGSSTTPPMVSPHAECDQSPAMGMQPHGSQIQEHITVQVTSITTHSNYLEGHTSSHSSHTHTHVQFPYSSSISTTTDTEPSISTRPAEVLSEPQTSMAPPSTPVKEEPISVPSPKLNTGQSPLNKKAVSEEPYEAGSHSFPEESPPPYSSAVATAEVVKAIPSLEEKSLPANPQDSEGGIEKLFSVIVTRNEEQPPIPAGTSVSIASSHKVQHAGTSKTPSPSKTSSVAGMTAPQPQLLKEKMKPLASNPKDATPPSPTSSSSSSSLNFEHHSSITICNKSLAVAGDAPPVAKDASGHPEEGPPGGASFESSVEKTNGSFLAKDTQESFPVLPSPPVAMATDPEPKKSWSQLFKKTAEDPLTTKQVALVPPFNAGEGSEEATSAKAQAKKLNGSAPSSNGELEKTKIGGEKGSGASFSTLSAASHQGRESSFEA